MKSALKRTVVDTFKTVMQVEGKKGLPRLIAKVKVGGAPVLFRGAMAWSTVQRVDTQ